MNRTKIKNYAPQARRDFLQAVTDRAAHLGLTEDGIEPVKVQGDLALIGGRAFPRAVADKRKRLEEQVRTRGFGQAMEGLAYTWFNRMVALRFMELHGYLDHGYRVLSHPDADKTDPEILEHAEHVELPGLNRQKVIDLKLESNKEAELYRLLLIAQCNALSSALPFLFQRIDDETELVLPDNLLHSDSIIRKLVAGIDEEDWQEVEIIGWLYESYISDRYEAVIGKVVASEDIPAATQRFTPKWIVQYLVQNTIGRQWLATYPDSPLRSQMKYYIEPAEQTPEVQEQLRALTPTSLNPEEMTLLDPACGSGHILVEAYDLFKAIYQERGYRAKDIPALILTKNLFGLEIDDRAAQLAAFALVMKARADDRRILKDEGKVRPNVLAIQESKGLNAQNVTLALNAPTQKEPALPRKYLFQEVEDAETPLFSRKSVPEEEHVSLADMAALLELFEDAKTFGSLIRVPPTLVAKLPEIEQRVRDVARHGELNSQVAKVVLPLVEQARMLAQQYDAVIANPPYMGGKYFTGRLKDFVAEHYKEAKADLYACFIVRNIAFAKLSGFVGMITIPNWMFLSSFEAVRQAIFDRQTIESFAHNGRGVFGSDFGSCNFVIRKANLPNFKGVYRRLFEKQGSVSSNEELAQRFFTADNHLASVAAFKEIPGAQIAYWASDKLRNLFAKFPKIGDRARKGISTGDNSNFVRSWWEVEISKMSLFGGSKWFPVTKGGPFRRWYGNFQEILNYENDGSAMRLESDQGTNLGYRMMAKECFFLPGVTWSDVSIAYFSARMVPAGFIPMDIGPLVVGGDPLLTLCTLNSRPALELFKILSPAIHFSVGHVAEIPEPATMPTQLPGAELVEAAKSDWDSFETSWDFRSLPIIRHHATKLHQSQEAADDECWSRFRRMKELEVQNNRLFIAAYGLEDELSPDVLDEQITLYRSDRAEDAKRLLSYAIGCMMGRYSLNKPGLIYAHSGNAGFDPSQYKTFPADDDGIVPLLDTDWGIRDDATNRIVEFIGVVWVREGLEENLKFIADSLGPTKDERPRETIRRYLATGFYKDHLRWYKRRPIYWLFSSGKQRAFQALVYLHRYNEGTLARMRTEYVIPLLGKIATRIEQLETDKTGATSTSHRRALQKEQDLLQRQQTELQAYDEKLRHYADQRIKLDLDDGVKVNYGKFGDLLAEVKAVTGGTSDE